MILAGSNKVLDEDTLEPFKKICEKLEAVKVERYVDKDYAEYLRKRLEKSKPRQYRLGGLEGETTAPNGLYAYNFETFDDEEYPTLMPLKDYLEHNGMIKATLITEEGKGIYMKVNASEEEREGVWALMSPDF